MKIYYGLEYWERLVSEVEEVIETVFEENCDKAGETFEEIADRLSWPILVLKYTPRNVGGEAMAKKLGENALEIALEYLDEEYGDPEGDYSASTPAMKAAAQKLGQVIVAEYQSWMCEPTGEVVKVTREEAKEM